MKENLLISEDLINKIINIDIIKSETRKKIKLAMNIKKDNESLHFCEKFLSKNQSVMDKNDEQIITFLKGLNNEK